MRGGAGERGGKRERGTEGQREEEIEWHRDEWIDIRGRRGREKGRGDRGTDTYTESLVAEYESSDPAARRHDATALCISSARRGRGREGRGGRGEREGTRDRPPTVLSGANNPIHHSLRATRRRRLSGAVNTPQGTR